MKYFSRDLINYVLDKANIVFFIKNKIKLYKKGQNFFGICPFHLEKNPSFVVNEIKKLYHCFGCGAHGNIIDFVMHYDHLSFIQSITLIIEFFNITIISSTQNIITNKNFIQKNLLYKYLIYIHQYYKYVLYTCNEGKIAYQYLLKRGYNNNIIRYFSIGYSPSIIHQKILLNTTLLNILQYKLKIINLHTLTKKYYDIFHNRIIFPIKNLQGYIVGFGGRIIQQNKIPKYINSSDSIIFHKNHELYGLYEITQHKKHIKHILVVEGYTDVISLFQFNIKYVVAVLGAHISSIHIKKLFCITNMIIYCYDGDAAGMKAHWKSLKNSLIHMVHGKSIGFMILPNNEDPDSLIRKEGTILFEKRINNILLFSDFFFQILLSKININTCEGKTKLSYMALSLIRMIPDYLFQINLVKQLGNKIGLMNLLDIYQNNIQNNHIYNIQKNDNFLKKTTIRLLISLLIQHPQLSCLVPKIHVYLTTKVHGLSFFIHLIQLCNSKNITTIQIIEKYRFTKLKQYLEILALWNHMIPNKQIKFFFMQLIHKLKIQILEDRQNYLISVERTIGLNIDERKELWFLTKRLAKK
ncbi:DNA primase [Enterobacteriaceae endosymbiont of Macroplea appendiculata]|uniref:DNA primase n=1 Tax=Enterobacteriaceae endosymbiont of Macroplea appendiculata TaxID=2675790 RepID=UPI0014490F12|nr:DNA primase [Enterobacteriaceae endosymbiont of Macroplea appendiculata]QJC30848.1 DNA primase [Enterobacteriaceae endosymbiont of Macroplea appendiculata]